MIKEKILFLGYGIMASRMIKHLAKNKYDVYVYTRSYKESKDFKFIYDLSQIPKDTSIIISCLSDDKSCEEVWNNDFIQKLIKNNKCICIEHSTISYEFAMELNDNITSIGGEFVECPVTGSKDGAENGKLVLFISNQDERVIEVLKSYSSKHHYFENVGEATKFKLLYNFWGATMWYFTAEFAPIIKSSFSNIDKPIEILSNNGPMASLCASKLRPIIEERFEDVHFKLEHMKKDMEYGYELFKDYNIDISALILEKYKGFVSFENNHKDYTIISKLYE